MWWVWVYTTWVTNWLDPEQTPVRILLFLLMLGGLVLSTTIPQAFEGRGLWFAMAYVAMQVGRALFLVIATPSHRTRCVTTRRASWPGCAFPACSGFSAASPRERSGSISGSWRWRSNMSRAAARFWTPGLGFSSMESWAVEGGHMAERCSLFVIIALGESIVVTGATFAELTWSAQNIAAFVSAMVGSIAMWWIYFHKGAEAGAEMISKSEQSGRVARLAYTYLHLPIVAGIILAAVADELVLKHPDGHSDLKTVLSAIGGPAVFLVGTILFKYAIRGFFQLSHLIGIIALVALAWFASGLSPLWLSILTTAILIAVAVWESLSLDRSRRIMHAPLRQKPATPYF